MSIWSIITEPEGGERASFTYARPAIRERSSRNCASNRSACRSLMRRRAWVSPARRCLTYSTAMRGFRRKWPSDWNRRSAARRGGWVKMQFDYDLWQAKQLAGNLKVTRFASPAPC
jgi:hypothetical protein